MLPAISSYDNRWNKFDAKNFNVGEYNAHADLNGHIRNRLNKLKREDAEKQANAKIQKEKEKKRKEESIIQKG